jgi:hypothetical protein
VAEAAGLVLDSLPVRLEVAVTVDLALSGLEVAAVIMATAGEPSAWVLTGAIDRWRAEAHMVDNPIVAGRRQRAQEPLAPRPGAEPIDLDGALEVARARLAQRSGSARIQT